MSERAVGVSHQRVEVTGKLTGDAVYTGDLVLPGMLHAKVKKSPHARARIVGIDTSRAEALRGVHAVLTGHELDYRLGLYVVDKDILAKDVVRHFGEAVAAVAAETPDIASDGGRPDRRRVRGPHPGPRPDGGHQGGRAAGAPRPRQLFLRGGGLQPAAGHQRRERHQDAQG